MAQLALYLSLSLFAHTKHCVLPQELVFFVVSTNNWH